MSVLLGFLEPAEAGQDCPHTFPSKVGGKPAWLDLANLPSSSALRCEKCQSPLSFLLQLYAPLPDPEAFHRTLMVFACQSCGSQIRCFRYQLPQVNAFWAEPVDESNSEALQRYAALVDPRVCAICGVPCDERPMIEEEGASILGVREHSRCAKAKKWGLMTACFPVRMIEVEEESEAKDEEEDFSHEAKLLQAYQEELQKENPDIVDDEGAAEFETNVTGRFKKDPVLSYFLKRTAPANDQVVRYDLNGDPLWLYSDQQATEVPNCPCGAPRRFEFQVMPGLLSQMPALERLDFAVLAVYSCSVNCAVSCEAYVHVQPDFTTQTTLPQ